MNTKFKDLIGKTFYYLTVLKEVGKSKYREVLYLCQCQCGEKTIVSGGSLTRKRGTYLKSKLLWHHLL